MILFQGDPRDLLMTHNASDASDSPLVRDNAYKEHDCLKVITNLFRNRIIKKCTFQLLLALVFAEHEIFLFFGHFHGPFIRLSY